MPFSHALSFTGIGLTGDGFFVTGVLVRHPYYTEYICFIYCRLERDTRNNHIISELLQVLPPLFLGGE